MTKVNLQTIAATAAQRARDAHNGRGAESVISGATQALRQTVIAMTAGTVLAEHESPGEATLQVISGTVELGTAGGGGEAGEPGDLLVIPAERHDLRATTDAVVLLTVAKAM